MSLKLIDKVKEKPVKKDSSPKKEIKIKPAEVEVKVAKKPEVNNSMTPNQKVSNQLPTYDDPRFEDV